jgi:phosphomannomutase
VRFDGVDAGARMAARMAELRAAPPTEIGGRPVEQVVDFLHGHAGLAPTDLLRLVLRGGARVQLRPSGTEPKLKIYVETVTAPGAPGAPGTADADAAGATATALVTATRALIA